MSPSLTGVFFTTEPPGKPLNWLTFWILFLKAYVYPWKVKGCPFISESGRMGELSPRLHTKNWTTQSSLQIPLSKLQSLYVKNGILGPVSFYLLLRWCWRRLLRVPWTARRSNQSILKEISPEYSLEGLMLKLQCFGHLMPRAGWLDNTLMLGKIEGRRRRGDRGWDGWKASSTQ